MLFSGLCSGRSLANSLPARKCGPDTDDYNLIQNPSVGKSIPSESEIYDREKARTICQKAA